MIKILVVGNGFDKAHGLRTGYVDFLEWIEYICGNRDVRVSQGEVKLTVAQMRDSNSFQKKYPDEYDECVSYRNNFWVVHFEKIRDRVGEKWLDFESEIETFTKQVYKETRMESQKKVIRMACDRHVDIPTFVNSKDMFKWLDVQLRQMTRLLEIYLCVYVNKTIGRDSRLDLFADIKANKLISFNYTSTYQDVYNKAISVDYIHGKARLDSEKNNCNLVLGYDDHYFESVDTVSELIPFEKYYQRIINGNSNNYFNWLELKNRYGNVEEKEVHFYGHSLSPADGDIIKLLIEAENTRTKIYYRRNHEEDRADMVKNLAVILTPNGLIKRMGGLNPTIELIPV